MAIALIVTGAFLIATLVALAFLWRDRRALSLRSTNAETRAAELDTLLDNAQLSIARLTEQAHALEIRRTADVTAVEDKYRAKWEETQKSQQEHREEFRRRVDEMQTTFKNAIDASTATALKTSSEHLLKIASDQFKGHAAQNQQDLEARRLAVEGLVKPIAETLRKTDEKLAAIERDRLETYGRLDAQIRGVAETGEKLRKETGNLVQALRKPQVRGRYGEIQLRRVAELAGMRDYCDFSEQESSRDDDGALKRPDMVVRLPNGRAVAVDAKTNIEAYLDALEADNPQAAEGHIDRFARHISDQAEALSKKEYWSRVDGALDFVVMFIPGDQFIDAALSRRPDLLEFATQNNVIIASPSTLIGLLRAIHVGWREKRLTDSAAELFTLGRELHERAAKVLESIGDVGERLDAATKSYNTLVGSLEKRMMPTLRKFEEAGARSEKTIAEPKVIDTTTRAVQGLLEA